MVGTEGHLVFKIGVNAHQVGGGQPILRHGLCHVSKVVMHPQKVIGYD